jgi:hypothetical protein
MTAKKKTAVKKPVAKKRVLKPAAVKPVKQAISDGEKIIVDKIAQLMEQGYNVQLKCAGRAKLVNPGEDLLEYIRQHNPYEIVGMKSGSQAVCFGIK